MTERVFRQRLLQLWLSFTVLAALAARVLSISTFRIEAQKATYSVIWLAAVFAAIVLYHKGSITDSEERAYILAKAHFEKPGKLSLFCSWFMLALMPTALGFGIWESRGEISWEGMLGFAVGILANLALTTGAFRIVRNEYLRRMHERGKEADSQKE
jgi:hypothetical protein